MEEKLKFQALEVPELVNFKTNFLIGNQKEEDSFLHQANIERIRRSPKIALRDYATKASSKRKRHLPNAARREKDPGPKEGVETGHPKEAKTKAANLFPCAISERGQSSEAEVMEKRKRGEHKEK